MRDVCILRKNIPIIYTIFSHLIAKITLNYPSSLGELITTRLCKYSITLGRSLVFLAHESKGEVSFSPSFILFFILFYLGMVAQSVQENCFLGAVVSSSCKLSLISKFCDFIRYPLVYFL